MTLNYNDIYLHPDAVADIKSWDIPMLDLSSAHISNKLGICPLCNDTQYIEVHSTCKIPATPIYTVKCTDCNVKWESTLGK